MKFERRFTPTTPERVRACIDASMSVTRAAEVLGCSVPMLRIASSLFGWSWHGRAGAKRNMRHLVDEALDIDTRPAHNPTPHNPFGIGRT